MDAKTLEQLASDVEAIKAYNVALKSEVAGLRSGLDYAVYGIGNPHPDPREQGEPVE